jgi:flagellin-like hook-associated protein FlgL
VEAVISTDLGTFFVGPAAPSVPIGGEQVTVQFSSADIPPSVQTSITTPPLAGGETAAGIAALLNAEIGASPALAGGLTFMDEGGILKLVQSDTLGVGFSFTSFATGGLTTGLEGGGVTGGQSAEEIAAALNAAAVQNSQLQAANVRFRAVDGQVEVDGDVDFTFTAVDFHRGAGFASGLAGIHRVGGRGSANILGALHRLEERLSGNDQEAIAESVRDLQRSQDHLSRNQAFYGGTLRQVNITLESLSRLEVVHESRLSDHQDADVVDAISRLANNTTAEQFVLQVAARRQPSLFDFLA